MKAITRALCYALSVTLGLCAFTACSFPFSSVDSRNAVIKDIGGELDFASLSRQGFMGGSVFYNPAKPSAGQLVNGAIVAVRLGRVERSAVDGDSALFSDVPEAAEYGALSVTDVDKKAISFSVNLYNAKGASLGSAAYTLAVGESADINGDGLYDLQYRPPARKRAGLESAIYLTFLSSQESLNTSMFAVLPNQYSRSAYPSGIIGINPDDRFIVSKYEGQGSTRSLVAGVQKGDYVLDSIEGKYQRVVSTGFGRSLRSIAESEVEDIGTPDLSLSYAFTEVEFADGYDAETLFSALPDAVRMAYRDGGSALDRLNAVLVMRGFIAAVAQTRETPIPAEDFDEVLAQIGSLNDGEMTQLNRIFMEASYPDLCPRFIDATTGMAEILPLASLLIGEGDEVVSGIRQNGRAASGPEYDTQRAALEASYGKYKTIFSKSLESPSVGGVKIVFNNSFVKVGVKGSFSASWGNVDSSVDGVVFLSADTNVETTIKFTKNLFSAQKSIVYPVFTYGPIVFKLTASVGVDVPLSVSMPVEADFGLRAAFSGLYEAGVKVGLDYGVRWKKKWIIKVPVPYCDSNGSAWGRESTIYYVGSGSPNSLTLSGITATINPNVNGVLRADISDCVYGQVVARAGLTGKLAIAYVAPALTGTATVNANAGLTAEAGIGLKVPVINHWYGKKWNWNLIGPYDRQLASWQVFRTTF